MVSVKLLVLFLSLWRFVTVCDNPSSLRGTGYNRIFTSGYYRHVTNLPTLLLEEHLKYLHWLAVFVGRHTYLLITTSCYCSGRVGEAAIICSSNPWADDGSKIWKITLPYPTPSLTSSSLARTRTQRKRYSSLISGLSQHMIQLCHLATILHQMYVSQIHFVMYSSAELKNRILLYSCRLMSDS